LVTQLGVKIDLGPFSDPKSCIFRVFLRTGTSGIVGSGKSVQLDEIGMLRAVGGVVV